MDGERGHREAGATPVDEARRLRGLLDGRAGVIYAEIVQEGVLADDDPRWDAEDVDHDALAALRDVGLLQRSGEIGWVAVDPHTVQASVVAPLGREAVALLGESAAWAETLGDLARTHRRTPRAARQLSEVRGLAAINRFLDAAVDDCREELLTAQPRGARRPVVLEQAVNRDIRALERGVRMRTLYQHTARSSRSTRDYVATMLDHGAQVRTLDEFFNRLIVVDRQLAVIPGDEPETAVAIEDRRIVAYLVDLFDRSWERGRDYELRAAPRGSEIAHEVRRLTVRMLAEGHSDSASAKRVGVSTRTYASYVAALKQEYGVQTRFQLGLAMRDEAVLDDGPGTSTGG